ncbi:MAG: ferrochelatase [Elusimicrobia bacterium]|nr:ferrochelatase [Elusimicrobiota bacterium]
MASKRVGVALLTMGEPEKLDDVRPFLRKLLADRDLVRLPWPALQPVFAWAVSALGAGRLRDSLSLMGGGSPLVRLTGRQAEALQAALAADGDYRVYAVMRYCRPSAADAAGRMRADGVSRVVALPLYPQYYDATSGSSLKDLREALRREGLPAPAEIGSWSDHPGYLSALFQAVASTLPEDRGRVHLLLCGHGLREPLTASGRAYLDEVGRTLAAARQAFPGLPCSLAWQGQTSRGRWVEPATSREVERLGRAGVKTLAVAALSFVSDHSETLWELDIELKRAALAAGIEDYRRVPAFNDSRGFILALRDLVLRPPPASGKTP